MKVKIKDEIAASSAAPPLRNDETGLHVMMRLSVAAKWKVAVPPPSPQSPPLEGGEVEIDARASREKVERETVESKAEEKAPVAPRNDKDGDDGGKVSLDHPDDAPAGGAEATQTGPRPLPGSVKFRRN